MLEQDDSSPATVNDGVHGNSTSTGYAAGVGGGPIVTLFAPSTFTSASSGLLGLVVLGLLIYGGSGSPDGATAQQNTTSDGPPPRQRLPPGGRGGGSVRRRPTAASSSPSFGPPRAARESVAVAVSSDGRAAVNSPTPVLPKMHATERLGSRSARS